MNRQNQFSSIPAICPKCKRHLKIHGKEFFCERCEVVVGQARDDFIDFMLEVELGDEFQKFYEEEGTEADEQGGPRINAQKFKIPNIKEVLPSSLSVDSYLDMGCGGGWIMEALIPEINPEQSAGLDISATRLHEAKQRNRGSLFYRAPVEGVPIKEDSFDLITCLDVIEHIPEPSKLLDEAHRLSPRLVIKFPIEDTVFDRFQKEFWWPFKRKIKECLRDESIPESFEAHLHRFSFESAKELLRNHGFEIVDEHIILNPWSEGESFMYPPAYNINAETPISEKIDFYAKRGLLKGARMGTYLLLNPWYYRIFNSGIYLYCKRIGSDS